MNRTLGSLLVLLVSASAAFACASPSGKDPQIPDQSPNVPATVLASFGRTTNFRDFESAERELGWKVLRPRDDSYTLVRQGGLIRTFEEIGLPRLEQHYSAKGHESLIQFVQEPADYKITIPSDSERVTINGWSGQIWHHNKQAGFIFDTGESIKGQAIRASVWGTSGYTADDVRAFVSSLGFGIGGQ